MIIHDVKIAGFVGEVVPGVEAWLNRETQLEIGGKTVDTLGTKPICTKNPHVVCGVRQDSWPCKVVEVQGDMCSVETA